MCCTHRYIDVQGICLYIWKYNFFIFMYLHRDIHRHTIYISYICFCWRHICMCVYIYIYIYIQDKYFQFAHTLTKIYRINQCCHILAKGFPGGTSGKEYTYQFRRSKNRGFDPSLGRCPEGDQGNSLQYFCLEKPVDREEPGSLQLMGSQIVTTEATQHACMHFPSKPHLSSQQHHKTNHLLLYLV